MATATATHPSHSHPGPPPSPVSPTYTDFSASSSEFTADSQSIRSPLDDAFDLHHQAQYAGAHHSSNGSHDEQQHLGFAYQHLPWSSPVLSASKKSLVGAGIFSAQGYYNAQAAQGYQHNTHLPLTLSGPPNHLPALEHPSAALSASSGHHPQLLDLPAAEDWRASTYRSPISAVHHHQHHQLYNTVHPGGVQRSYSANAVYGYHYDTTPSPTSPTSPWDTHSQSSHHSSHSPHPSHPPQHANSQSPYAHPHTLASPALSAHSFSSSHSHSHSHHSNGAGGGGGGSPSSIQGAVTGGQPQPQHQAYPMAHAHSHSGVMPAGEGAGFVNVNVNVHAGVNGHFVPSQQHPHAMSHVNGHGHGHGHIDPRYVLGGGSPALSAHSLSHAGSGGRSQSGSPLVNVLGLDVSGRGFDGEIDADADGEAEADLDAEGEVDGDVEFASAAAAAASSQRETRQRQSQRRGVEEGAASDESPSEYAPDEDGDDDGEYQEEEDVDGDEGSDEEFLPRGVRRQRRGGRYNSGNVGGYGYADAGMGYDGVYEAGYTVPSQSYSPSSASSSAGFPMLSSGFPHPSHPSLSSSLGVDGGIGGGGGEGRRQRTRPSAALPIPIPVPNLTKKSRGRRVPTVGMLYGEGQGGRRSAASTSSNGGKTPARLYTCKVPGCGKCFARGEHLKRHVRSIHTWEKPHKCPYPGCGKDFSRHDNLGQHMRVHKDYVGRV
ncbi:hypothetical protein R3P38DRAFT_3415427 [Favolaschia claudopus]|uniref:C2H2-type domain-containing protein n=1 Tax=Favolaschia claudopus TaxID=2862362 RepID=A0AAW0EFJ2_9AGAR